MAVTNGDETLAGLTPFPLEGSAPALSDSAKTPFKPDEPCENQDPPDLASSFGPAPEQSTVSADSVPTTGALGEMFAASGEFFDTLQAAKDAASAGDAKLAGKLGKQVGKLNLDYIENFGGGD